MSDKKVVLITGGGKGIGFGVAKAFAKEGYNIVITGRTQSTLEKAKKELEDECDVEVLPIVADGSIENDVKNAIEKTINKFNRLDALINNAQASKSGLKLEEHSSEDFKLAIDTGLYGTFYFMREAFPHLKKTEGSIVNFASGAGLNGNAGQASYAASKEGIRGLSRVAANEWGEHNINVNIVCPLVMTPQLEQWKKDYPEAYKQNIQKIPMKRFGDAEKDIGRVCVFLTSDDAKYMSGETIALQGGGALRP